MSFQRTIFASGLVVCAFLIIAAYSYRTLVLAPRISATLSQAVQSSPPTSGSQNGSTQSVASNTNGLEVDENVVVVDEVDSTEAQNESAITDGGDPEEQGKLQSSDLGTVAGETTREQMQQQDIAPIAQQMIFDDQLLAQWQDWSWGTTVDLKNTNQAETGTSSIAVRFDDAWGALWLSSGEPLPLADYDVLRFWLHGGETGGQMARVGLADANQNFIDMSVEIEATANTWHQFNVPLIELGAPDKISGISFQDAVGGSQPTFFVDQISLVRLESKPATAMDSTASTTAPATSAKQLTIEIDVSSARREINPDIYGINYGSEELVAELGHTVRRWGGNATTRYNWQLDVSNRASDWFFENIAEEVQDVSALPKGSSADRFVVANQATGAKTIMTMPMIGWTPKSRDLACAFPVSKYGEQQQLDQWRPECGNGYSPNGEPLMADPYETSISIDTEFVSNWIDHLVREFGNASQGGVTFYSLDNEPMLWHHTHRDVHPEPVGYDELYERSANYAAAIKRADASALTLGPALWGWTAYEYSAKDIEESGGMFNRYPDRAAHGDMPLVAWYLQQMANYERQNGVRILDYLDIHYYPQADGIALSSAGGSQNRQKRLRSTRSLWDSSYIDESWIDEPVQLIPRMREWVDTYYPETKLALTEYNFGALENINGALTQAEVLGIFGREGVDLATLWDPLDDGTPFTFAFQIYRNYDNRGSKFGDISIQSTSTDHEQLSVFSAQRSTDNAVTALVINKSDDAIDGEINVSNFQPTGTVLRYRYSAEDLNAIQTLPEVQIANNSFVDRFPQNSFTLLVIQ